MLQIVPIKHFMFGPEKDEYIPPHDKYIHTISTKAIFAA